jgi:peptidoglycan lytic transglycosylase G
VRRGLVWTLVIAVSLGLVLAAGGVLFVIRPIQYGDPAGADPVRVDIPAGATLAEIADRLHAAEVIRHPFVFKHFGALAQFDRQVRPGEYEFVAGEPYRRILERLREGDIIQIRITVPEGRTRREIAQMLQRKLGIDPEEFMRVTEDPELLRKHAIDSPTFEGYLFPDTYFFPSRTSAEEVLEAMLQRFFTAWTPADEERARAIGMTRGQVLTLASIIEGEALLDSERPRISAVYHNRLRRDMLLQADPTVLYALGGQRRRVYYSDLLTMSPYNTYVNRGLPPGPICNPGLESIEAALSPTPGIGDLYFVAARDGTGRHLFSKTLSEHLAAKRSADRRVAARRAASKNPEPADENGKGSRSDSSDDKKPGDKGTKR